MARCQRNAPFFLAPLCGTDSFVEADAHIRPSADRPLGSTGGDKPRPYEKNRKRVVGAAFMAARGSRGF